MQEEVGGLAGVAVILGLYLIPTITAYNRKHHQAPAITAVNVLFGWTLLGWGVALVWALTEPRIRQEGSGQAALERQSTRQERLARYRSQANRNTVLAFVALAVILAVIFLFGDY